MTPLVWAGVVAAGSLGAVARLLVDTALESRRRGPFRWGTWVVNVSGSLLVGVLAGAASSAAGGAPGWFTVAAGGFAGAYTTFSTWVHELLVHAQEGRWRLVGLHLLSVVAGVAAVAAGWVLGMWLA